MLYYEQSYKFKNIGDETALAAITEQIHGNYLGLSEDCLKLLDSNDQSCDLGKI